MSWNIRILKHTLNSGGKDYTYYGAHEVYYTKDGTIAAWDEEPTIQGDTIDELIQYAELLTKDLKKRRDEVIDTNQTKPTGFGDIEEILPDKHSDLPTI